MPRGKPNKGYTGTFKQGVVERMRSEKLSCSETARLYEINDHKRIQNWERIYLTYGAEGLYLERRGRGGRGAPPKKPKDVEEDLLAEVQRLRAEVDCLKNLDALVSKRVQLGRKHM